MVHDHPWSIKRQFLLFRKGSQMNRRVSQNIDNMNLNSAELSVKLCETLREILQRFIDHCSRFSLNSTENGMAIEFWQL